MIITISREFGAGGHSVASKVSEKLGLEFYDVDFVRLTASKSGYSEEDVRREGEDMKSSSRWMNSLLDNMVAYTSSYDAIFKAQREVVIDLAKKPGIIVGRCANIILREEGLPSFDVFLYADHAFRLQRIKEMGEYGSMDPEKYLERRDEMRRIYYKVYTKREMGDYRDYDLCLDTGTIGIERCAQIIADTVREMV